jgi:CheY-like chemotaxis protein
LQEEEEDRMVKIPFISACSAFSGEEIIKKTFDSGMRDYISKPIITS